MSRTRVYATNAARQRAYRLRRGAPLTALQQYPSVQIGELITLYQGDAHVIAPLLRGIDALISDPPYGTQFDFTKPRRSRRPLQGGEHWAPRWTVNVPGDEAPFDPAPWLHYPQIILWGAQHFAAQLPNRPGWLVWDKRAGTRSDAFGDVELAWTNLHIPARRFTHLWRGIIRAGEENVSRAGKLHPCQKPVGLMLWCVRQPPASCSIRIWDRGARASRVCGWGGRSWALKLRRRFLRPPAPA